MFSFSFLFGLVWFVLVAVYLRQGDFINLSQIVYIFFFYISFIFIFPYFTSVPRAGFTRHAHAAAWLSGTN